MPNYIVQGSDLSSVASAIRTKGSTSEQLAFPAGFVSAIEALPSGGGQVMTLLASGSYTKTDYSTNNNHVDIPVSFSGTPVQIFVYAETPVESAAQTYMWARQLIMTEEMIDALPSTAKLCCCVYKMASGTPVVTFGYPDLISNNTVLRCAQQSSSYHVQDNTYKWFIWGYAS